MACTGAGAGLTSVLTSAVASVFVSAFATGGTGRGRSLISFSRNSMAARRRTTSGYLSLKRLRIARSSCWIRSSSAADGSTSTGDCTGDGPAGADT